MSQAKPNGHAAPKAAVIQPEPSDTTMALEEQIASLKERLAEEQVRDKQRAELLAYILARPSITHRDVLRIARAMSPLRSKRSHKTRVAVGYKPLKVKPSGKVGRAIDQGRKAKNLSTTQLQKLLRTSGGALGNWSAGRNLPTPLMRKRLAKVLGMPEGAFAP